jgi:2-oxoisovalerate dehydrogenase E2 component (dihydrolipoyl transacylase)
VATTKITMPQLGESVHEGTISKWLVKPGDRLEEFEPMLEVDTDKVNAEVPSPVTGILKEILAQEGETVEAGGEIALVEVAGEAPEKVELSAEASTPLPPSAQEQRGPAPPAEMAGRGGEAAPPASQRPAAAARADGTRAEVPAEHRYSPGVLMLAEEKGVDLAQVRGSGLGGRVTKKDVREFAEARRRREAAAAPAAQPAAPPAPPEAGRAAPPAAPAAPAFRLEGDEVVPLSRMRRLIAENTTRAKTTIPHAWQTQEVDMSGVVASRAAQRNAFQEREGFSLTYLPYVIAAAVSALRQHPQVNATFSGEEILVHRRINLGVSVGFEDGLVVPVIRNADGLSLAGIARAVNDLATRAREKRLQPDELQGGTFTVNNSGTFGTLFSYSVINPGQSGILTMEAIVERPVAVDGMLGIKPMMYLCFSFDHRVVDGLLAARFLRSCREWLESVGAQTPIY